MSEVATGNAGNDEKEYLFVRRPVLAMMISITVTLMGLISLLRLPVNTYPQITPPAVQVIAVYPGASATDVATAVAAPIERQLTGLQGLLYYSSSNASDGTMNLTVTFDISRDQDLAAVDVQNAINLALPQLPASVRQIGVTVTKANANILLIGSLRSSNPQQDAAYLTNYGQLYVEDELQRLPGVGNATFFGALTFSMLLSLDPDRMAQLGLTVDDVTAAVLEQNATQPAGRLGREPSPPGTQLTLSVTTTGRLTTPEEFGAIIVRARSDGSLIRVRDIATVTIGSLGYDTSIRLNGVETALFGIYARPGANNLAVKKAVVARMGELQKAFPAGVKWSLPFDTTPFITQSITEVVKTLAEAMLLVTLVVFIFLQTWRATLIPVLAVPVSIIGTFLGLELLGFTINTLTLFAMVLAIGMVVDDAIVVIENVERIMERDHVPARVATTRAMRQISSALIAIVLVLCSVFIPVAFISGITGAMYQQFAVTIVIAVVLSGMVALTLTPALTSMLLKDAPDKEKHGRVFTWFNDRFGRLTSGYVRAAGAVIGRPRLWFAALAVLVVLLVVVYRRVPGGFIPGEDKGYFAMSVRLPDAASLQRTVAVVKQVEDFARATPGVQDVVSIVGLDLLSNSNQTNAATMFVALKPWGERSAKGTQLDAILARMNMKLMGLEQAIGFAFNLPEIPGVGTTSGLELNLQQRSGTDIRAFASAVQSFVADANRTVVTGATGGVRVDVPQMFVQVDKGAAYARGVNTGQIFSTLQAMLSTLYINDLSLYGRPYRVQAQAQSQFRQRPEDIGRFYVRSTTNEMVPLSALVQTEIRGAPTLLTRFNGFPSVLITGTPKPGQSSGEMLAGVQRLVDDKYAAQGIGYAYSGESYQETAAGGTADVVLVLSLVLVFLVLAAQYDSWSVPFGVLLGLPFGVFGAVLAVWLRGMSSDVYFQIGLFAVVGLAAKNAILIVEFATELRAQGHTIHDAALEAARERFRPILMTSLAFILGVAPLVIASGAGAASRQSVGTSVFFGMLGATSLGVFFIPLYFYTIRSLAERRGTRAPVSAPSAMPAAGA